jgi:hypothetical protein
LNLFGNEKEEEKKYQTELTVWYSNPFDIPRRSSINSELSW